MAHRKVMRMTVTPGQEQRLEPTRLTGPPAPPLALMQPGAATGTAVASPLSEASDAGNEADDESSTVASMNDSPPLVSRVVIVSMYYLGQMIRF